MHDLGHDVAHACRRLRQAPGFTAIAALTLALGIGANTTVFSIIDPLLLRRLPVREPDQLVFLHSAGTLHTIDISERAAFERYSAERAVFDGVIADAGLAEFETMYRGQSATALGEVVSGNYFAVLGVSPHRGRLLSPGDDAARGREVVLGFSYWARAFGGDSSVIGQTLLLNGRQHTIVGIAPREFFGITVGAEPDFYAPLESGLRNASWVKVVGRLQTGITRERAAAALTPVFNEIVAASAVPIVEREQDMARFLVTPAAHGLSELRDSFGASAWLLTAGVALMLLVASANVASLMITRATGRRQEMAVRLALGAKRTHLVRQFVLESAVIAIMGTAVGLLLTHWGSRALVAWLSIGQTPPLTLAADVGARVLLFSAAILSMTVLLCGVLPGFASTRIDVGQGLKLRSAGLEGGGRPARVRQLLTVAQIAASVTLLVGAGLLVHSLVNLYRFHVGFDLDRVLAVPIADSVGNRPPGQADRVITEILTQIRSLPGVEAAGLASLLPLTSDEVGVNVVAEGSALQIDRPTHVFLNSVTPGYFETLGISVLAGRGCPNDGSPAELPAAIINQRLARHLFGETNAVRRQVRTVEGARRMVVVGVAADAVYTSVRETPRDFVYMCRAQSSRAGGVIFVRSLASRADGLAAPVQRLIQSVDSGVRIKSVRNLAAYLSSSLHGDRLIVGLFSGLTIVAVLIAAVGLYGVLAGMVSSRTPEIGLRMALGAEAWQIFYVVAGPALKITGAGLVFGVAGAFFLSSTLSSLLFGVEGSDPITYVGVVLTLACVASLACYVPARLALRLDPVAALRRAD